MRKIGRTRQHIRYVSCMIAAVIGLLQPCAALAVEEANTEVIQEEGTEEGASEGNAVNYITAFEKLAEEDAYFPCMYKPSLEELVSAFPETLSAWIDEGATLLELEVTWECEEDFDATLAESYVFYPQWDDVSYPIADSVKDNIEIPLIRVEVPSGNNVISNLEEAKNGLQGILQRKNILALVYLCDKYEVKQEPSYDSGTIHTVVCGQSVQIIDVEPNAYGSVWYQVLFYRNETAYKGYIEKEYLATSDEDFAEWENTYLDLSTLPSTMTSDDGYPDVDQFPASYQNALYALKQKHPNWIFVRMDTGIDWATAIEKELGDKSLVPSKSSGSWQNGTYGQGWSYASEGILKYYMDPRNFLTDPEIFQFEQLTFNSSYHTTTAVQEVLKNSFMSSTIPGDSQTYAQAFTGIGQNLGVSPFHLASRVLQEQGTKGSSALISGTYAGYEGYYNYFNVGASGKTDKEVVQSGLKRAISEGWNTRYKSLYGGAAIIGAKYILQGQDTLYLEKFNVSNGGYPNFTHQYMQNIQAPSSESVNIRKAYNNAGALENSFVFKIPVYLNMPASACSKPETTDAITLDKTAIDSLEVNRTVVLIPYVNGSKVDYVSNMTFASSNPTVADVDSQGKVTAKSPGTTTISCTRKGANTATCTVTVIKANPTVSTPVLSPRTYQDGLKLSDIALPDGWEWTNAGTKIGVGTFSYPALYTPEDTTKYNTVTKEISFTITKAIPNCQMPEKLEAKTGMVLGEIELPNGFTWESNVETELKEAGEFTFYVSYNPDEKNYYTVEHIPIIVHVIKSNDGQDDNNGNTSSGSTSSGSTSSGSTSNGSTSSGSTSNGSTSNGSTSSGSTSNGSTSNGSTSNGSSSNGSTSSGSTSSGSTSNGSTSSGSTSNGSTSNGSTSSGSTSSGSTSSGSTSNGSTSSGSSSNGSTSSGSSSNGSTSSGSTSNGSTSSGSSSNGSTSNGSTSSGSTSSGSTSNGSTSSGSTSNGSTSNGSTSNGSTSNGSTSSGSSSNGSTSSGSTSNGSTSSGSTSNGSTSNGSTSSGSTSSGSTLNGSTSINTTSSSASSSVPGNQVPVGNGTNGNATDQNVATGENTNNGDSSYDNTDNNSTGNTATPNGNADNSNIGNSNTVNNSVNNNATDHTTNTGNQNPSNGNTTAGSGTVIGKANNTGSNSIISESTPVGENTGSTNEPAQNDEVQDDSQTTGEEAVFRPSVTMQMEDTTFLTVEKLQMAKEQNFNLVLNMGNHAAWSINVDSVDVSALSDVDMGIELGTENIPADLIAAILNGNKYLEFTLYHDGLFGFGPVLNIALDPSNNGRYANLFYYNSEIEELEFIDAVVIDADGIASFQMDHASCYVIIVSDSSMEGVPITDESVNPIAKWIVIIVIVCMVLLVIGGGIFFYKSREDDEEEDEDEEEEADLDNDFEDIEEIDDGEEEDEEEYLEEEGLDEEEYLDEEEGLDEEEYADDKESLEEGSLDVIEKAREIEEKTPHKPVHKPELQIITLKKPVDTKPERVEDGSAEDDWIEDEDWQEPDKPQKEQIERFADDHAEDDWIDDDEWNIENDWMDDAEWERKKGQEEKRNK